MSRSARPSKAPCTSEITSGSQEDPVLAGPISDAVEPLPELPQLWLVLARRVGLIVYNATDERLEAVSAEFWAENALHLPQMTATSWLGLRQWSEWAGSRGDDSDDGLPLSFLRPALLLWLASLGDDQWVALDDLAAHLEARNPAWDRLSFDREPDLAAGTGRPRVPRGEKPVRRCLGASGPSGC